MKRIRGIIEMVAPDERDSEELITALRSALLFDWDDNCPECVAGAEVRLIGDTLHEVLLGTTQHAVQQERPADGVIPLSYRVDVHP